MVTPILKELYSTIDGHVQYIGYGFTLIAHFQRLAVISVSYTHLQWSVFDCMAVGSGFAYYSLSSILITQFKEPSIGLQLATE